MYRLQNFHRDYPNALVITASCGDTVSLSCRSDSENDPVESSSTVGLSMK